MKKNQRLKELSEKEISLILEKHAEWVTSKGDTGARASFANTNLEGKDFCGKNLVEANFAGAYLISAKFMKANLQEACFADANLYKARLEDADCNRVDFSRAQGLVSSQFAGANLTCALLPESIDVDKSVVEIESLIRSAKTMFIGTILACFYTWIVVGSTQDSDLLTGSVAPKLPLMGFELNSDAFYLVGPIILLAVYFYSHIYLQRLWERLVSMPAVFPDGKTIDEKVYPWLFLGFIWHNIPRLVSRRPSFSRLQYMLCVALCYILVPLTLYIYWGAYLTKQSWDGTLFHIVYFSTAVYWAIRFFSMARKTIKRDSKYLLSRTRCFLVTNIILFAMLFLSWGSINGVRQTIVPPQKVWVENQFITIPKPHEDYSNWNPKSWVPRLLLYSLIKSFADLDVIEVSKMPNTWNGDPTQILEAKGARLYGAKLRFLTANDAFLVNTDFRGSDLLGASFDNAKLQGAKFTSSRVDWAMFANAELANSDLSFVDGKHCYFAFSNLKKCNILAANLSDSVFWESELSESDMRSSIFENSTLIYNNFSSVNLTKASFVGAHVIGDNFQDANCSEANFTNALLYDVNFSDADLSGSDFSGFKVQTNHVAFINMTMANVYNMKPFWLLALVTNKMGAVSFKSHEEWEKAKSLFNGINAKTNLLNN